MSAPNRLTDLLALSHVPRWSIVDHLKPQTVSDHVFRVMVIATELARRLELEGGLHVNTYRWILEHDASECRTADIPTPAKKILGDFEEVVFCPWMPQMDHAVHHEQFQLFRLADIIEATTFIRRYGIGPHAFRVHKDLCRAVDSKCPDQKWRMVVRQLMLEMDEDTGR